MSDRPNSIFEALAVFPSVPGKPPVAGPAQPGPLAEGVKEISLQSGRVLRYNGVTGESLGGEVAELGETGVAPAVYVSGATITRLHFSSCLAFNPSFSCVLCCAC